MSISTWAAPPATFLLLVAGLGLAARPGTGAGDSAVAAETQWRDLALSAQSEALHQARDLTRGALMRRARWHAWACVPIIQTLAVIDAES